MLGERVCPRAGGVVGCRDLPRGLSRVSRVKFLDENIARSAFGQLRRGRI